MHAMQCSRLQAIGRPGGISRRRPSTSQRCTACTDGRATANFSPPATRPRPHNTRTLNPVQPPSGRTIEGWGSPQEFGDSDSGHRSVRSNGDGHQQAGRPPATHGAAGYRSTEHNEIVSPFTPPPHSRMTSPARVTTIPLPVDELWPYRRSELESVGPDDLIAAAALDVDDPCRRHPSQVDLQ